tara:strand:- start:886 stop:1854 length:969 start_codon:yes stop_codon:yes gene_type:complete
MAQINPSNFNRFRNIFYQASAKPFATGDLISLGVLDDLARGLRGPGLQVAKLMGDLRSLGPRGQGIDLRLRRRIAGRFAGRVGHIVIPQGLGFVSRMMNRFYGRFLTKSMNNYFNEKVRYRVKINGGALTQVAKQELKGADKRSVTNQFKRSSSQLIDMGVDVKQFNPANILSAIQKNMIGRGPTKGNAPLDTGNLRRSINLRGFTSFGDGLIQGTLTVGSSKANAGPIADKAPYWWKTVYGGFYDFAPGKFIPPRKRHWFKYAVDTGLKSTLPGDLDILVNGTSYKVSSIPIDQLQPPPPSTSSFELSAENKVEDPLGTPE